MNTETLTTYGELADLIEILPVIVRETRRARRLSLRSAAAEIGCSFSTIDHIESGVPPRADTLTSVLRWLDRAIEGATP